MHNKHAHPRQQSIWPAKRVLVNHENLAALPVFDVDAERLLGILNASRDILKPCVPRSLT